MNKKENLKRIGNFFNGVGYPEKVIRQEALDSWARVLITGKNRTGKELFAQAIHNQSPYAKGPFLPLTAELSKRI